MNDTPPYRDYAAFLADYFSCKMQKLSVDGGFSCPNRDGTISRGGCTYCNNRSFAPGYCREEGSVSAQLQRGKEFFGRKYPQMRYLAYFQSFTSTHADPDRLMALYEEALGVEGVDGIVIGTRPDCVPEPLMEKLAELRKRNFVMLEFGAESSHDRTLRLVNRCHTWADTVDAVRRARNAGIPVGLHLIMGLPGESEEDMLATIDAVNALDVNVVKLHQLQIVRGTTLHRQMESGEVKVRLWEPEAYADFCCKVVERLRKDIAIDRFVSQTPEALLVAPRWGLKNYEFTHLLLNKLKSRK